jgi:hypothetical protein
VLLDASSGAILNGRGADIRAGIVRHRRAQAAAGPEVG